MSHSSEHHRITFDLDTCTVVQAGDLHKRATRGQMFSEDSLVLGGDGSDVIHRRQVHPRTDYIGSRRTELTQDRNDVDQRLLGLGARILGHQGSIVEAPDDTGNIDEWPDTQSWRGSADVVRSSDLGKRDTSVDVQLWTPDEIVLTAETALHRYVICLIPSIVCPIRIAWVSDTGQFCR
ncbi:hypothetical protein [Nocardia xishanensis]